MYRAVAAAALIAALAQPAHAEPPEGKGKKAEPLTFVLKDCGDLACGREPQQVGTVISVSNLSGFPSAVTLVPFEDSLGTTRNVLLRVERTEILMLGGDVWYGQLDCGGPPFTPAQPADRTFDAFDYSVIIPEGGSDVRALYVVVSDAVQIIETLSGKAAACFNIGGTSFQDVVPLELIDSDLHTTFPPPYSLEPG